MRQNVTLPQQRECYSLRTDQLRDHRDPFPSWKLYLNESLDVQRLGPMQILNFVANIISDLLFRGLSRRLNTTVLAHHMTLLHTGMLRMMATLALNLTPSMNSARPIRTSSILLLVNNISMPYEFDILTLWVILLQLITFFFFLFFFVIQYYFLHISLYIFYILHTYIHIST